MRFQSWCCSPTSLHWSPASAQWLHSGKLPATYHHLLPACRGLVTQLPASAICSWIIVKGNKYPGTTKRPFWSLFFSDFTTYWPHKHSACYLINLITDFTKSTLLGTMSILWNLRQTTYNITFVHAFSATIFVYDEREIQTALSSISCRELKICRDASTSAGDKDKWISSHCTPSEKQGPCTRDLEKSEEECQSSMIQTF